MSSAKSIQARVFGGQDSSGNGRQSPAPPVAADLSIQIPKPKLARPKLAKSAPDLAPSSQRKKDETHSKVPTDSRPYRERLVEKLGTQYDGVERYRLEQDRNKENHWKRWGPYLSERQWATVREDYSANGDAWSHFPHSQARSRAYRWGEDGIAGISDNHQRLCFALAFWNGQDGILKERLFGLANHQGNHGEDCKEIYYYLDSTPTHSYMKYLYKYPQRKYPYDDLVKENQARSRDEPEYELMDTGIFDDDRYWDIFVEYAKDEDSPDQIYVRITAYNRGPDPATLHILPTLWFPNTWSWPLPRPEKPSLSAASDNIIVANHKTLGRTHLYCFPSPPPIGPEDEIDLDVGEDELTYPELLFTENETNFQKLYGGQNESGYAKDAFHDHVIPSHRPKDEKRNPFDIHSSTRASTFGDAADGEDECEQGPRTPYVHDQYVNPEKNGTKAAAHYILDNVPGNGGCAVVRVKLTPSRPENDPSLEDEVLFDDNIEERRDEANEFYHKLYAGPLSDDLKQIMRQSLAGMLWTKQYYQFVQQDWIKGDPAQPPPPPERKWVRNKEWRHLHINDILSMPDKWEYPFFAAWDSAFHCIPLAMVDPEFAKKQLMLFVREWYMKPDGQIPAYEWNFSDVNPPVHAWATFRVFKIERKLYGREDFVFLETVFQKLLLNFTWWVNRKDAGGNNVFEGGFLGLDNIGPFNRSEPLPTGGQLRQADGTAWMAFYCLNMLNMALELAKKNPVYEGIASKFFEHFIFISDAMTFKGPHDEEFSLWNEQDGLYYDVIQFGPGATMQVPVRSLVGLIPLYATLTLEPSVIDKFPGFKKRMEWFIENRPEVSARNMANMKVRGKGDRRLLALASKERLIRILERMLDETEFLSDYGIRSLSKYHESSPWGMDVKGEWYDVSYWPGDSKSGMFGGNSNWRGPIWIAVNFLLIESLQRFYQYYGNDVQIECPTGSGEYMNLAGVAEEIQHRIIHIFSRDQDGRRATNAGNTKLDKDPNFKDYIFFHEFFHGDTGQGLGASHQTGWTGLVAFHVMQSGISCRLPKTPRTPRSTANHYFDENIDSRSEYGGDEQSLRTPYTGVELTSAFGDVSPDAL